MTIARPPELRAARPSNEDKLVDVGLEHRAIAAACLAGREWVLASQIEPSDFTVQAHRNAWSALTLMASEGEPIDVAAIAQHMQEARTFTTSVRDVLGSLPDTIPAAVDCTRLRRLSAQRRMRDASSILAAKSKEGDELGPYLAELDRAREALERVESGRKSSLPRFTTADIFAPLPAVPWVVQGLRICPGRPNMVSGYGFSGKTLAAQALGLGVASGTKVWCQFDTSRASGRVLHIDYEQGKRATFKRYQRLVIGHGIDPRALTDRLEVMALPRFYLDELGAYDIMARESEGVALVIIDSLRAAAPNTDENDSRVRIVLDNLTRASEATGAAFLVIHHDGKPKEGQSDSRTTLRGSSGIFDACGCILGIGPGKTKDAPHPVHQKKGPAEAEGAQIDDFELAYVDVPRGVNPTAGLRVECREAVVRGSQVDENREKTAEEIDRLLSFIREHPGCTQNALVVETHLKDARVKTLCAVMEERRLIRIEAEPAGRKSKFHFPLEVA